MTAKRLLRLIAPILLAGAFLPACGDDQPARILTPMVQTKDKAVWTAARANLDTLRTALGAYAAGAGDGLYPAGPLDYPELAALLPGASLPPSAVDAKFAGFRYESTPDRQRYTVTVRTTDHEGDTLTATPSGVEPSRYPY